VHFSAQLSDNHMLCFALFFFLFFFCLLACVLVGWFVCWFFWGRDLRGVGGEGRFELESRWNDHHLKPCESQMHPDWCTWFISLPGRPPRFCYASDVPIENAMLAASDVRVTC
jgi:hypothetical protein